MSELIAKAANRDTRCEFWSGCSGEDLSRCSSPETTGFASVKWRAVW
jgi:hypothetical protein